MCRENNRKKNKGSMVEKQDKTIKKKKIFDEFKEFIDKDNEEFKEFIIENKENKKNVSQFEPF